MIDKILICRHGFRANWVAGSSCERPTEDRDVPLAAHGVDQSRHLAEHLKKEFVPSSIYSSPFKRCLQTAQPTAQAFKLPIKVEPVNGDKIQEWFHENPPNKAPTLHPQPYESDLKGAFVEVDARYQPTYFPNRHGESLEQLHERCKIAIDNLILREEKKGVSGTIIIFTHAASAIALGRALIKDSTRGIRTGCTSYSEYSRLGNVWELKNNGYSQHLPQGEERHWDFSLSTRGYEDGMEGTENIGQGFWGLVPEARL
ncbi:phosphoglycerate mutase-like protein [Wallemia mellicola]|uniref:Phosphoglycerate mutase-like protein n=1 Tax=Wallemia mellicola TaxID=1708541 RepID=A0A4T0MC14_9BASI|nr:phosphoglycerate mutase-like protein [Wallemia mellicola]